MTEKLFTGTLNHNQNKNKTNIYKEDNVFSMTASFPYGPPVITDIGYYQTFLCKCCNVSLYSANEILRLFSSIHTYILSQKIQSCI